MITRNVCPACDHVKYMRYASRMDAGPQRAAAWVRMMNVLSHSLSLANGFCFVWGGDCMLLPRQRVIILTDVFVDVPHIMLHKHITHTHAQTQSLGPDAQSQQSTRGPHARARKSLAFKHQIIRTNISAHVKSALRRAGSCVIHTQNNNSAHIHKKTPSKYSHSI